MEGDEGTNIIIAPTPNLVPLMAELLQNGLFTKETLQPELLFLGRLIINLPATTFFLEQSGALTTFPTKGALLDFKCLCKVSV